MKNERIGCMIFSVFTEMWYQILLRHDILKESLNEMKMYKIAVFVKLLIIELLAVIVVGAVRNFGNIFEQSYIMFMPQFPNHLRFFYCRTLSETKAFNFFNEPARFPVHADDTQKCYAQYSVKP